jgi:hypothetical protein
VKKTRQNKEIKPPFRFNRNGKGSQALAPRQTALDRRLIVVEAVSPV